ncbi:MAG TPA: (d)CMP kinase [Desulfobulbaceae bacterium]|nr:MAG: cytidylate kinase [Deltaproteobacteria bacterium RIFOXYD12_FULL_53_23]HCC55110.1 (d)CMP kinase [Desulfobulbaceae bacterium]
MLDPKAIVTIDGPSGAGKSTISRGLAAKLNFTYLDTGAMYRAVGLALEKQGLDLADTTALEKCLDTIELSLLPNGDDDVLVRLNGEDVSQAIRTPEMGLVASRVSAHPLVREKLTALQRQIGERGGIVAEGRDMGTVVFPKAACKFFLTASGEERARRRQAQLAEKGQTVGLQEILDQISKRDYDDSRRQLAPLKPAVDAIIVDSSSMGPEAIIDCMLASIAKAVC